jgi:hypothetical protein
VGLAGGGEGLKNAVTVNIDVQGGVGGASVVAGGGASVVGGGGASVVGGGSGDEVVDGVAIPVMKVWDVTVTTSVFGWILSTVTMDRVPNCSGTLVEKNP